MVRLGCRLGTPLEAMATEINEQTSQDLPLGRFVTAFLGVLAAEDLDRELASEVGVRDSIDVSYSAASNRGDNVIAVPDDMHEPGLGQNRIHKTDPQGVCAGFLDDERGASIRRPTPRKGPSDEPPWTVRRMGRRQIVTAMP